jgi:hypothetical protein
VDLLNLVKMWVGDYTRCFWGKQIRKGHEVQILALCDYQVIFFTADHQVVENTTVFVNQIPISAPNNQRCIWLQDILNELQPDWISLQFVPYSFNQK